MTWTTGQNFDLAIACQRLDCRAWGRPPAEAPTIVMLHEGLGSVQQWKNFPAQLQDATGFGVLAYSRAGYGRSTSVPLPRPLDYMTREAEDVLPELLDTIGFRRGILLGHSDGASIAAIYAGSVPDTRLRGLCLMAPHFFTEPGGQQSIAAAKIAYETGDLRHRLAKYHTDPDCAFRGWNDAWLDPDFLDWNIEAVIDRITAPVLAIQGKGDQYGTIAHLQAIEQRCSGPVRVELLTDCGHAPHFDQPEQTIESIASWLTSLDFGESAATMHDQQ